MAISPYRYAGQIIPGWEEATAKISSVMPNAVVMRWGR